MIKQRDSNLELLRIITMLVIVAHHYVVNSGLISEILECKDWSNNALFLLLFGCGGKIGINCFVMITGYFMCLSSVSVRKYLKLILQVEFYKIVFYILFVSFGKIDFSVSSCLKSLLPIVSIKHNFVGCFLVFYLMIPFLNVLIRGLSRKQHQMLLLFSVFFFVVLPQLSVSYEFNYVGWFTVVYFIASYLRKFPPFMFENKKIVSVGLLLSLALSFLSVVMGYWWFLKTGHAVWYYFVIDSNSVFAVLVSIFLFLFFKNLHISYSKLINLIAASCFGVLLIHANSDAMRHFLWHDLLHNTSFFNSNYLVYHAFFSVFSIYVVCTIIDFIRIHTVEHYVMKKVDGSEKLKRLEEWLKRD